MEAYRDQYATLFNAGRKVTVIGISVDPDTTQADWARESGFPVVFASDVGGAVGKQYGAYVAQANYENRYLFVVAPDGTIAYRMIPFRVLAQQAYTDLAAAVAKLAPPSKEGGGGGARGSDAPPAPARGQPTPPGC